MNPEFLIFIKAVLLDEKGYSRHYNDAGNWTGGKVGKGKLKGTKDGISAARYPNEDIENLSRERIIELYYEDFWKKFHCDKFPDGLNYYWFDMVIQHGQAVRLLQETLNKDRYGSKIKVDNIIGGETIAALPVGYSTLIQRIHAARAIYYLRVIGQAKYTWYERLLYPNASFANGWANRIEKVFTRANTYINFGYLMSESSNFAALIEKRYTEPNKSFLRQCIESIFPEPKIEL